MLPQGYADCLHFSKCNAIIAFPTYKGERVMGMQSSNILELDKGWKVWWQLPRPHTLTAAFVPVFLGSALTLHYIDINFLLFLAMLVACLSIQATTNMFNDYYDYVRGLDNEQSVGIGGAIVRNRFKPSTVMTIALSLFGIAALLGVYICLNSSWWTAIIGIVCMAAGYFYTGGPLPIAYTPFGEIGIPDSLK
jgi:1,4-dihydroxy-2-naphthoate polyprenyltransferase